MKIIIQARTGSQRLPTKVTMPLFENKSIIDILVERLKIHYKNTEIVLATTEKEEDKILGEIAEYHDISIFYGSVNDVLKRYIDCAETYGAEVIVRICADNPFLLPEYIDVLIKNILKGYEYSSFKWPNSKPVMLSHIGLFAEAFTLSFLKKIRNLTNDSFFHEHVTNYLYGNKKKFKYKFELLPSILHDKEYVRLTIDTKDDFEVAKEIYKDWLEVPNQNLNSLLDIVLFKPELIEKMKSEIKKNEK